MKWTPERHGAHPPADVLFDWVVAVSAHDRAADARVAAHADLCVDCRQEAEALAASLDALRADLEAEADAVFTPLALDRQRAAIMRRLVPAERARVLAFPARGQTRPSAYGHARRWVAGAAAAGLLVGVIAGRVLLPAGPQLWHRWSEPAPAPATVATTAAPANASAADDADEIFLTELDMAAVQPRIEPLRAIDALTPRSADLAAAPGAR
jgi:hypothetical protein